VKSVLAAVAALAVVAACTDSGSPTRPPVETCPANTASGVSTYTLLDRTVWTVLPIATNACITQNPDSHFVALDPTVPLVGRLFVFLPGSSAEARSYRRIVAEAAGAGYHALGLTYVNDLAIGVRCAFAGSACYSEVREEIVTGDDTSGRLQVGRDDSIEGRLVRLLEFMALVDPDRGWDQFVNTNGPRWDLISVAGHSQGGGHSLFIAQRTSVFRATAYSSAGDLLVPGSSPAPWVAEPWATPAARRFGFISEFDELVSYMGTVEAWTNAGLAAFGPPAQVDGTAAPFGGSHMLTTRADPRNPATIIAPNHGVTVVDIVTPLDASGEPVFAPVWRALSFPGG
jgi:hypothetical protein